MYFFRSFPFVDGPYTSDVSRFFRYNIRGLIQTWRKWLLKLKGVGAGHCAPAIISNHWYQSKHHIICNIALFPILLMVDTVNWDGQAILWWVHAELVGRAAAASRQSSSCAPADDDSRPRGVTNNWACRHQCLHQHATSCQLWLHACICPITTRAICMH